MKSDIFQLVGLAAIVAGLFLLSTLAGTVGLIVAGAVVAVVNTLEELDGSRTAPSPSDKGHP